MVPFKSKRSESRRSSILKPRKPRQPLQNVNFDSSSNENSPTASKVKRRVSFAEKKHVKEFCHSTEQGTVWDNTYEEHDFSLKGSFVVDQNVEAESKENTSLHASNNACIYVHSESNSCYPNNIYLVNNQLLQNSIERANEKNNDTDKCDLDFTNPAKSAELSNISQLKCATLSNKSCVTKDTLSNGIVAYSDSDEEYMELPDEKYQSRQTVTNISKNVKSNNIMIYRDSDEKDYVDNVAKYSELCSNNINSELDKTCVQDLSMEITTPISASLLSSHLYAKEHQKQKHDESLNNLDTNYTINCNNISMEITEAVPIFAKSVASNSGIPKEIPAILQNCENIKWDATNTYDMIFSTNLQSNIVSKDISEHTLDMNCTNDSMILTSVIQPFTDVTDICCTNNTAFDTSMGIIKSPQMFKKMTNNENIIEINVLKKDQSEKSEIFNDVLMEMTKPIDTMFSNVYNKENFRVDEPISRDDGTMFFHNVSMEMTKTVSTKSKQEIIGTVSCKSISGENAHSGKNINIPTCFNESTKILCKSMEFTETVPGHHERMLHTAHIAQSNKDTCENHENDKTKFFNDASMEIMESVNIPLNIDKSISRDNKTILFHNISENDVHLFPSTNSVDDTDRNACFVQDIIDHTQVSDSNLKDSLNEISEYSFLRKSLPYLENSLVELQSIKPPSFVCLDSEGENSFHEVQHELQLSTVTEIPVDNTSNRLIINNIIESKSPINLRENVTNNDFTIFKEKEELINTENNQTEDCHKSTIVDKTEDKQKLNCQAVTRTIINDNRLNKSNYYTTKNINEEKILLMNVKDDKTVTVQDINHCTSLIIKEIEIREQVDEREDIQKRINEDAELQNKIKEKGYYSDRKRQETEKCSDHLECIGAVIKDQADPEEHRKNLNDKEQQSIKQKNECATEGLVMAQYGSTIEDIKNKSLIGQDPFLTLLQKLETHAAREDCIWNIYYKDIDKKMIVFGFISNSLLIVTFLSFDFNGSGENLIKEVKIVSRISDDAGVLIRIVHKLIMEKVNAEIFTNLYRIHQDIFPMLNFISQDVKLAMDFMFDLKRLDDLNLMEIAHDKISFVSQSKRMDIILKITIKVKRFDKLIPNDINLCCLLGRIKETDIKNLIKNVKKDHKFLRRYMNDVKDYIDIMEETSK